MNTLLKPSSNDKPGSDFCNISTNIWLLWWTQLIGFDMFTQWYKHNYILFSSVIWSELFSLRTNLIHIWPSEKYRRDANLIYCPSVNQPSERWNVLLTSPPHQPVTPKFTPFKKLHSFMIFFFFLAPLADQWHIGPIWELNVNEVLRVNKHFGKLKLCKRLRKISYARKITSEGMYRKEWKHINKYI